jgi:hypothetical protein
MSKKNLGLLLMISAYLNTSAQCEYYEDSTSLRTVGASSAPLCNGSFAYCSKNGYTVFPHTGYRVLNLMINIIYDFNSTFDPLASVGVGAWNPGTPNTINSNPPSYLAAFMDQDFTTLPPQGIMTRKYYESSFGALTVKKILYL